jgi:hypothetical protein
MEAKKRQYYYENTRTSYIEGNTVRKLNTVPDTRREERPYEQPSPRRQERKQPKALSTMSFASLLVLTIAMIATVYVCVDYLRLQTNVTKMDKTIVSMEKNLTTLTKENDAAYASVNTTYDLADIYKYAVEVLGMVYPNNNEVITYQGSNEDYVRQYEDIPDKP